MSDLTHFSDGRRPRMVDVGEKPETRRVAVATGRLVMQPATLVRATTGDVKKGDPARVAEIAGVMAAKRTAELIPLCHPLALSSVDVAVEPDAARNALVVTARVSTTGKTGVEMEALTAVSAACLTLYDMLKAIDRTMTIDGIRLAEKTGGSTHPVSSEGTSR